jgi:lipopolysaccharide/colanic/teichoic acid biosynthesis glycosyltransferase
LFYTQERVGKDGVVFEILKFRTMVSNAETNGAVLQMMSGDGIGKFLRKLELMNFLNS